MVKFHGKEKQYLYSKDGKEKQSLYSKWRE